MTGKQGALQVVIMRDGLLVGTQVFTPGQYTIGCGPTADLQLDDISIDETQGYLTFQNGRVQIKDAHSSLGVHVNGNRVTSIEVRPIDEIAIGPFVLKTRVILERGASQGGSAASLELKVLPKPPPSMPPAKAAPRPAPLNPGAVPSRRMAAAPRVAPLSAPQANMRPQAHLRSVTPLPGSAHADRDFQEEVARAFEALGEDVPVAATRDVVALDDRDVAPTRSQRTPVRNKAIKASRPVTTSSSEDEATVHASPLPDVRPRRPATSARQAAPRPQPAPRGRRAGRSLSVPDGRDGQGRPVLFVESYWGDIRRSSRAYRRIKAKKPLLGTQDDHTGVPLWGFSTPEEGTVFAEQIPNGYRVYVPTGARVERREGRGNGFQPLPPSEYQSFDGRPCLHLSDGMAVRFYGRDNLNVVAYVQPGIPRPFINPFFGVSWLSAIIYLSIFSAGLFFVLALPKPEERAVEPKALVPVAVTFKVPPPKPPEPKVEPPPAPPAPEPVKQAVKEPPPKKPQKPQKVATKPKVKEQPVEKAPPPPPEIKALKALDKLAAGPAMQSALAAVDKLGSGPGLKNLKNDYKTASFVGKGAMPNAGTGLFGLGGGGAGGVGTKGAELLRGAGGGGVAALGGRGYGKGAVGGQVSAVSSRTLGVQGSIDREAVARVVNAHINEIRACYEKGLLKDPSISGKIVLEWVISTSGSVVSAKTRSSSMRSASVDGCILSNLKGWQFPPAKGSSVIVSYPFMFNSVGY